MELLERFASGDPEAFEMLFHRFQCEVYRWIVRVVRDPSVAEDLTVDTFIRIYRVRDRFDPSRPFGPWARKIAINLALNYLETSEEIFVPFEETLHSDSGQGGLAIDSAVQHEIREKTHRAVIQLPTTLRVVVLLWLVEDFSDAEIAQALGISTVAVRSRRFRAVRILKQKLNHHGSTR